MPSEPETYTESIPAGKESLPARRSRHEVAVGLKYYDGALRKRKTQREAAKEVGVPRGTLRYWNDRRRKLDLPDAVAAFLESPVGLTWLRQLVLAAVFVQTLRGPEGIRLVCEFLELSGLDEVVAASYGSVQKMVQQMQEEIAKFGEEQRAVLGQDMPQKSITVCEDETFHPQTCLVAIEPASDFILLERYVERRDAQTWNTELAAALDGLAVEVVQSTSDQGKALLRHARDLEAQHSPDLFHPQYDLSKATALPLASRLRRAVDDYSKAVADRDKLITAYDTYRNKPRGRGRPPNFAAGIERATERVEEAQQAVQQATADQEACREAIKGLGTDYHGYELETGLAQSAAQIETKLEARFATIDEIATRVGLSEKSRKKIDKARRVTADMVGTIRFVHVEIALRLAALPLLPELRTEIAMKLVPGLYLQAVATRAKVAVERKAIAATAQRLLAPFDAAEHPLNCLDDETCKLVHTVAKQCSELFVRSSSCVEGRNGHLALFHHGLHRLTEAKLAALTVVHNFHTRRPDGTTPADRFFETQHEDLFSYLLRRLPSLARPARPRALKPYRAAMRRAA